MKRVFGIDLGTNSIGWSIVEQLENGKYRHIKSGVDIFKDGVDHDKSGEHPCCNYELMREDCADIIFAVVYIK